jgi:hypothetical protein
MSDHDAVERVITMAWRAQLQRIGERYRFIHVLLRDHLASKA